MSDGKKKVYVTGSSNWKGEFLFHPNQYLLYWDSSQIQWKV